MESEQTNTVRNANGIFYLHSDHLGSASLATNTSGNAVANSSQRFTPFGSPRLNASGLDSKFTFTGQRNFMDEIGTMDYGSRHDSIVESGAKRTKKRVSSSGMRWSRPGLENMLALRRLYEPFFRRSLAKNLPLLGNAPA